MSDYNPFSLSGKKILVTGASSGIGQATAIECSRMGAQLVITGRNSERLQETYSKLEGEGHVQFAAELTEGESLNGLIAQCQGLNGVALCAGREMTAPFPFCTRQKFDDVFDVNFFSPVELLRLLVKGKRLLPGASVVIIASTGGTPGGGFTVANSIYGSSKAALVSMMKYCAKELAPKKIRVNTVNPAMTNTPLVKRFQENLTAEQIQKDIDHYPLKRYGDPKDMAWGAIYLLSDASSWVTGHSLVIDGGVSI